MIQNNTQITKPILRNIRVAVRVRPFNTKEIKAESGLSVQMKDSQLEVTDAEKKKISMFYDYCLWSHDHNQEFKDQEGVFDGIGRDLLYQSWEGYNTCLVAYGETGAGKSYTMLGTKPERGIVYRFCQELFKNIESSQIQYEVVMSIYEIEKEILYDHLTPDWRQSPNLGIKEGAYLGVYIPDLSKHLVKNYTEVEQKIDTGVHNFELFNNYRGQYTWRSSLIIQLELKQIIQNNHRVSTIQFVDLAGSEKSMKFESRQKQPISTLQQVIKNLQDKNGACAPYRDSKLTRILQNAFGGNCKTYMICSISPAIMNSKETLATLKYAQLARRIVNKVSIFQFKTNQLIDNQFSELISIRDDIKNLLQLIEKNDMSIQYLEEICSCNLGTENE